MLKDPPLLTIRRKFRRPDRGPIAKLKGAQTGHIVDALLGRGALDHHVKPVDPEQAHFVGPALTCEAGAKRQPGDPGGARHRRSPATSSSPPAMRFSRHRRGRRQRRGWPRTRASPPIVIDGMARDRDGIVPVGLPVFARGITPNSCVRSGPGKVGFAIVCGGVAAAFRSWRRGGQSAMCCGRPRRRRRDPAGRAGDGGGPARRDPRAWKMATQAKIRAGMTHLDSIAAAAASPTRPCYVD